MATIHTFTRTFAVVETSTSLLFVDISVGDFLLFVMFAVLETPIPQLFGGVTLDIWL